MTLKEFLEKYVSPTEFISVYIHGKDFFVDNVIYLSAARRVLESDLWSSFFDYKLFEVNNSRDRGLVINIKGE